MALVSSAIALAANAAADEALAAIDAMPQRYHLTLVDRAGVGHAVSGEWDRSASLSLAWHAAIDPRPLAVGLRIEAAQRREGGLRADEAAILLEVGAMEPLSTRWTSSAFISYGSGLYRVGSADLAPEIRHRLATTSAARAVIAIACRIQGGLTLGVDGGYRVEYLSDRWTRGGFSGRESGPVLAAVVGMRW